MVEQVAYAEPSHAGTREVPGDVRVTASHGAGASDCAGAATLSARLEPLLGDSGRRKAKSIAVDWSREQGQYRVRIVVDEGQGGERALASESESCVELEAQVVAVLAVLLDEQEADQPPEAPAVPEEPAISDDSSEDEFGSPEQIPDGAAARPRVSLGALGGVTTGLAPDALGWLGAELRLGMDWWQFGIVLFSTFRNAVPIPVVDGHIDLSWRGGMLKPCVRVLGDADAIRALGCPLVSLAMVRGDAVGYDPSEPSRSEPWWSVGAGITLAGPIWGPVEWSVDGTLLIPLQQQHFEVEHLGIVLSRPSDGLGAGFWLSAGLGARIW